MPVKVFAQLYDGDNSILHKPLRWQLDRAHSLERMESGNDAVETRRIRSADHGPIRLHLGSLRRRDRTAAHSEPSAPQSPDLTGLSPKLAGPRFETRLSELTPKRETSCHRQGSYHCRKHITGSSVPIHRTLQSQCNKTPKTCLGTHTEPFADTALHGVVVLGLVIQVPTRRTVGHLVGVLGAEP